MSLTLENYAKGFLVNDEVIGGVTIMDGGIYAAYVSAYLTGETLEYKEFEAVEPALQFLNSLDRVWAFEGVGCSTKTGAKVTGGGCSTGGCSTGGCGTGGCS